MSVRIMPPPTSDGAACYTCKGRDFISIEQLKLQTMHLTQYHLVEYVKQAFSQRTTGSKAPPGNTSSCNPGQGQGQQRPANSAVRDTLYHISCRRELTQASQCREFVQALHDNLCAPTTADVELVLQLLGDSSLPADGWKRNVRLHIDKIVGRWHQVMAGAGKGQTPVAQASDSTLQVRLTSL